MKHIRKIVSIACALQDTFGWSTDIITDFITDMSYFEVRLRKINEEHPHNNLTGWYLSVRNYAEEEVRQYLRNKAIDIDIVFTHSVLDVPFKMNLGLKYANHSDNVSFVINL